MTRVHNFGAGPAALPLPALERARDEMLDLAGSGMSVMEHSHRGHEYERVHHEAAGLLRELTALPASYRILFLQGGASHQFAMVPWNFLPAGSSADYVLSGAWSEKALEEARRIGTARAAGGTREGGLWRRAPSDRELTLDPDAAYVHTTSNNTLDGIQTHEPPVTNGVPLVCDMSSDFLWRPMDLSRYALVYAGAQKNIGPSGVAVVLAQESFLDRARKDGPVILRYATHAQHESLYHTPPTFGIYMIRNVLAWLRDVGGLPQIERWNREKAALVYGAIDARPEFYRCPVARPDRSFMNVVFRLPDPALEDAFVETAAAEGMVGLRGHRSVGGIRVSLYNAVSVDSARTLASFMDAFAARHGA